MILKEIIKKIDDEIEEKYNSRRNFCTVKGINYYNLTNLFNRIRKKNKSASFDNIVEIIGLLGYKFQMVKEEEEKKPHRG